MPVRLFFRALLPALVLSLAACTGNVRNAAPASTAVGNDASQEAGNAPPASDVPPPATTSPSDSSSPAASQSTDAAGTVDAMAASEAQPPGDPGATQAEQDYDALYGTPPYNPVYDPTLPAASQSPASYDPWEKWNRRVHSFNNVVDRAVAKPLAKAYVRVVPRPVRLGVGNFFNNLGQPVSSVNALLQGKPKQAGTSLGRFLVNTTVGIAGIFDPATKFKIPNRSEDFGQTLGVWGWHRSRFVELPLFGPRTIRDTFGLVGDAPLAPVRYIEDDKTRIFLQGLQLVDVRTQLFAVDSLREGATDEYALVRDAWMQRRNYQIFGDSKESGTQDQALPDYLRDNDDNPGVPADAMPIIPGGGVR